MAAILQAFQQIAAILAGNRFHRAKIQVYFRTGKEIILLIHLTGHVHSRHLFTGRTRTECDSDLYIARNGRDRIRAVHDACRNINAVDQHTFHPIALLCNERQLQLGMARHCQGASVFAQCTVHHHVSAPVISDLHGMRIRYDRRERHSRLPGPISSKCR